MNEIILDTETTGLSVKDNHRIVEIACVETKNLVPTKKIFYKLINPEREVSKEALKIHGYDNEKLKKEPKFKDIANEFLDFISDKKLIIHNASFDIGFINNELKKINKQLIDPKQNVIDTLEIARSKYPGSSNSLDNLCKKFQIDLSKRVKHNALLDCELLRKVYINLIGEKEPTLVFQDPNEVNTSNTNAGSTDYCKKIVNISQEELGKHKQFLKSEIKKNYF
tara:strand:+ start:1559 stop:2230 length:672 start_codon:yes stop_codon:yes gene_type:complete